MKKINFYSIMLFITAMAAMLSACGGGGGGSSSAAPASTSAASTTVTGVVFAAPAFGAKVSVKGATGSTIAGPVTTATDGSYSITIPTSFLSVDLRIESDGGTFTDEATGASTTAGTLAAYIPAGSLLAGSSVNIDPSSTIISDLVTKHGKTLNNAKTIFSTAAGYTPDPSIAPKNAPTSVADGSDAPHRLAALRAGAFSQLTKDLGLTPDKQFDLLAALAQDLNDDGILNGSAGAVNGASLTADIQNKFSQALCNFRADTAHNLTGLTAADMGDPPFGKIALTNTYHVEYIEGMMSATAGKTSFRVKITKRSDGSAATGLAVSLMPIMHMSTMSHSAPVDAVTEDSLNPGTYKCTAYYLMASGTGMGYWELKVMIGGGMAGESVTFYPPVGMSMGSTTVRATLKGQNDKISGTMGASQRTYYLFNDGGMTATSFKLFIAAGESMMSYPAVSAGTTLHDASSVAWTVNPITVSVSTDNTTWVDATDATGGHWTVSGLTGLTAGQTSTIYVTLTVNGEQKTTNGNAVSGANGYASFTVTP